MLDNPRAGSALSITSYFLKCKLLIINLVFAQMIAIYRKHHVVATTLSQLNSDYNLSIYQFYYFSHLKTMISWQYLRWTFSHFSIQPLCTKNSQRKDLIYLVSYYYLLTDSSHGISKYELVTLFFMKFLYFVL